MFFGSTSDFQALAQQIPDTASTVVIRLDRMQYMDQSGLYAMEDMIARFKKEGCRSTFCRIIKTATIYDGAY